MRRLIMYAGEMNETARRGAIQSIQNKIIRRADIQTALAPIIAELYRLFPEEGAVRDLFEWPTQTNPNAYQYQDLQPILQDLVGTSEGRNAQELRKRTIELIQRAIIRRAAIQTALAPTIAALYRKFPGETAVQNIFEWPTGTNRNAYGHRELEPILQDLVDATERANEIGRRRVIGLIQKTILRRTDVQTALAPVIAALYRRFPTEFAVQDLFEWPTQTNPRAYGYRDIEPILQDMIQISDESDEPTRSRSVRRVQKAIAQSPDVQTALLPTFVALRERYPRDQAIADLFKLQGVRNYRSRIIPGTNYDV